MGNQIIKYFLGELDFEKSRDLFQRIEEEEPLKDEFIRLQNLHAISQLSSDFVNRDEGKNFFELFSLRIKRKSRNETIVNMLKYVLAIAILVVFTVWITVQVSGSNFSASMKSMNKVYVPSKQRALVTLHGRTKVWLNAQSTLIYPSRFSDRNRKVEIIV